MTYFRKIVGEKCYLSPVAKEDAVLWARWLNDPEVTLPLGSEAHTILSLERAEMDVQEVMQQQNNLFTIVDCATDLAIGRCLLFSIDPVNRTANLGIFIGEKSYWGHGYGQEALRLLLAYAFDLLNLNAVMLGVFSFNQRAIRAYEKVGFRVIGHRRQARWIGGKPYDGILMDILADEFRATRGSFHITMEHTA